jgi:hypothetical protein
LSLRHEVALGFPEDALGVRIAFTDHAGRRWVREPGQQPVRLGPYFET